MLMYLWLLLCMTIIGIGQENNCVFVAAVVYDHYWNRSGKQLCICGWSIVYDHAWIYCYSSYILC